MVKISYKPEKINFAKMKKILSRRKFKKGTVAGEEDMEFLTELIKNGAVVEIVEGMTIDADVGFTKCYVVKIYYRML